GMRFRCDAALVLALALLASVVSCRTPGESSGHWPDGAWARHTIDDSSLGADGVRLADINGDGRLDVTSPWEQGGQVRVYLNPGPGGLRERWPAVTVGEVGDPEDAVFVDLDADGNMDVVSSCEGSTRSMFVHWGPAEREKLLDPDAWITEELPAASGIARWMFALPAQIDGKHGTDLIAGAKGEGAQIGWFEAPPDPRNLAAWEFHALYDAGWIMTIRQQDVDLDGDSDIVATDRTGERRGALWLENTGQNSAVGARWDEHRIGSVGEYEAMHNAVADLDADGLEDLLVAAKGGPIRYHRRTRQQPPSWETHLIEIPAGAAGGKAVKVADVDLDGQVDLIVSCEHATDGKIGVYWLDHGGSPTGSQWLPTSISGPEGFIYDLLQMTDVDGDGDLDVLTLEEKGPYLAEGYQGRELGVIWYENPAL
ncbi:MAG: VCBS repeat-containing protein, partial [Bryobacterales bacterium]|nr:VCBS repeat-containing protein [Bryobacterales bacterium]